MLRFFAGFALAVFVASTAGAADDEKNLKGGKLFEMLDKNGDKKISKEEFEALGDKLGEQLGKGKLQAKGGKLFEKLDANGDGYISEDEFRKLADRLGAKGDTGKLKSLLEKRKGKAAQAKPDAELEILPPPRAKE